MAKSGAPVGINYTHRAGYSYQERLVGLFVLLTLGVLIGALLASDKTRELFENTFTVYGHLPSAQGVEVGTQVRLLGIRVGKVTALSIDESNQVVVTMRLSQRFRQRLHADAKGALGGLSILGKSSIEIDPGSADQPLLAAGAHITVQSVPSLNDLMAKAEPVLANLQQTIKDFSAIAGAVKPERVSGTIEEVARVSAGLSKLVQGVRKGRGTVGALVADEALARDTKAGIAALAPTLLAAQAALASADARLKELQPVIADAGAIGHTTREATRHLPDVIQEVRTAAVQVNVVLATLNTEMQQLPDLVTRMKLLLDQANTILNSAQRIWPLSTAAGRRPAGTLIAPQPVDE